MLLPELAETTGRLLTVTVKGTVAETQPVTELLTDIRKSYVPTATPLFGIVTLTGDANKVAFVIETNPGIALVPAVMVYLFALPVLVYDKGKLLLPKQAIAFVGVMVGRAFMVTDVFPVGALLVQ